MPIRLDDEDDGPPSANADRVGLQDAVKAARRSVAYWEEELQKRVQEVQSLDGMVSTVLNRLLGTHEAKIEAGIAAVQEARARLEQARTSVERAEQGVHDFERQSAQAAAAREARDSQLEALADQVRGTAHPSAAQLDEIEIELDATEAELAPLRTALTHGASLAAYLGSLLMKYQRAADSDNLGDLASMAVGTRFREQLAELKRGVQDLPERARAFDEACQAIGLSMRTERRSDVRTSSGSPAFETLLSVTGNHWVSTMLSAHRLDEFHGLIRSVHEDTDLTVQGLQDRLTGLQKRADTLRSERRRLLRTLQDSR
ncbi:MAG: hypothetical protein KTR31_28435 [Myxococcales bacterium]|nr:hypothetical protein [Myxococcales bacterium]